MTRPDHPAADDLTASPAAAAAASPERMASSAPGPTARLASIRSRLAWLLVGAALVWGGVASVAVWLAVRHEVNELLDETLQASAEVLVSLLARNGVHADAPTLAAPGATGREEHFAWQLVGPGAQVLLRSPRAPERPFMPLATTGFAEATSGWRVYGMPFGVQGQVLYVAQTRAERLEAQAEVAWSSIWAALAIGTLSAWWLRRRVRRELQPLAGLASDLERYEPLAPGARLPPASRLELARVHDAIEALGRRLAQRVASERAFSGHAAHALRTPLAGIDTQLAVALREAPESMRPRLERVRQAAGRLTRVVSALLALFRSGVELQWQPVSLEPLLARLPLEGLELQVQADHAPMADPDLLTAALLNLLDNALRHGARRVQVRLQREGDGERLILADDGRGVAPDRRADLQAALDAQDYEGRMGLGLMLTDLVVRAHGGRLNLPAAQRGFVVELVLGPAPQPGAGAPDRSVRP